MPGFQIHTLDLCFRGRPEGIAAYLVIGPEGPVLVETGPGSTLPVLERALAGFNVRPEDLHDVLVTHIHLDHAGAAGWWARRGARVHVHHVGAPHLIDPAKLLASARRIYGDQMETLWGEILPAPPEQIHALHDGEVVRAGGLDFVAHDTPGHARHHLVFALEDQAFAGDLAGIRLAGRPLTRLPTPPPEFDLEAWHTSVARMRAQKFAQLYLTHYGATADVDEHWAEIQTLLDAYAARARDGLAKGLDRDGLVAEFEAWERSRENATGLSERDRTLYLGGGPIGMSVDGLIRYWQKRAEKRGA